VVVSLGVSVIGLFGIALCYLLVDRIGRKPVQVWGFGILVVVFFVLGIVSNRGFVLMAIFFVIVELADQGPGITTYLFAGELFPTSVRASGHGTATAASRIGAFLGIVALPVFVSAVGLGPALLTFGACDLVALLLTVWLAPEPKGKELVSD
jgi:predicted MFS family arabinose efflux permease